MSARKFRLIDTGPGDAAWNMAVDEVLLRGAAERPALRLYAWRPAALSLGYFQDAAEAGAVAAAKVVRRLTGGGAILHEDELTFSVAAPLDLLGGEGAGVRASFEAVNRAVRAGLARVGVEIDVFPSTEATEPTEDRLRTRRDSVSSVSSVLQDPSSTVAFDCWKRSSDTDLRVGGRKLVGSAQRRRGRCVLHHGSIPLGTETTRGERFTVSAAARRSVGYDEVAGAVAEGFRAALGAELEPADLTAAEREAAERLVVERYGAEAWTARR